jgi:beta-galactosidase/beta-glucuronidase
VKVPFWLQPEKYYVGAAWYQKVVEIPANWKDQHIELLLERCHWETRVWVDDQAVGMQNSLATPHIYNLSDYLAPGKHTISILVDNQGQSNRSGDQFAQHCRSHAELTGMELSVK